MQFFTFKSWLFLWLFLASLVAVSCLQDGTQEVDAIDIHADSTLLSLTTVKVTLLDSTGQELQVLFDDSVTALSDLSRLRLDTPYRGQVSIRIEGWKDGVPAYLEVRDFDLTSHELNDVKVVFHPAAGISRPPVLSGLLDSVDIRAGNTLHLTATAHDSDGPLAYYNWRFTEDTLPDTTVTLSETSVNITGSHVYLTPGEYHAILSVSDNMTVVSDTVVVTVKAVTDSVAIGPDTTGVDSVKTSVPAADAGADATVATDSLLVLHGRAKGGSGPIIGYAWKLGLGANDQGGKGVLGGFGPMTVSGDTSFKAPLQSGAFMAVLMATDSAGQSDLDTVLFTVIASANANLASLTLDGVELDPVFRPATEIYTASVPFETTILNLRAVTAHRAATVKVGARYLTPADSAQISLKLGDNLVEAVVLSQSGLQKKYQVTVTRRKSTETHLANLDLTLGGLNPNFHPDTLAYTVTVGNEVDSLALKALALDSTGAVLRLVPEGGDSVILVSGKPGPKQALDVGARVFLIRVVAQDGAANRTYRVSVTRQASPNAMLLSLTPSSGTLKPSFQPETVEYFDTLPYAQTSLRLRGVPANVKSKLYQSGQEVAPDVDGKVANLPVGDTTLSIVVRAEAGDSNTYRVRVHRKSNEASLKALTSSETGLPKGFGPGVFTYNDTVGADIVSLTVNPVATHALAKAAVASPVTLKDGANSIEITVTAEDGNTQIYTWNVYRISGSTGLSALVASSGNWGALFEAGVFVYKDTVPESVVKLSVKATPASAKSKVYFQGMAVAAGTWADSVTLVEGVQTLKVKVVAESGDSTEYILTLYRTSANAQLKSLSISPGSLSPVFAAGTLLYADTLNWADSTSILVGTLINNKANIVKIGTRTVAQKSLSENLALNEGVDTLLIVVRAEQGNETTYKLVLTRMFHPASLSNLVMGKGIVDSTFERNRLMYVVSQEYKYPVNWFTPTCSYSGCTIMFTSVSFPWGPITPGIRTGAIPTPTGSSIIQVAVTGAGGVTRTYTIKIEREKGFVKNFASGNGFQWGVRNSDRGYSILGNTNAGSRLNELYMIKTDFAGDSLWSKSYGTPFSDYAVQMKATYDNGLVILGRIPSTDALTLTRTDAAQDAIWTKTLAKSDSVETGCDVTPTSDGGFVVLVRKSGQLANYYTVLMIKIGSDGNQVWRKELDVGKYSTGAWAQSIQEMSDGSLVMAGTIQLETGSAQGMLLKTNSSGDLQWVKAYPNADPGDYDYLNSVSLTNDGGVVLAGYRSGGSNTGYIVRADMDGNEIWIKDFGIGSWSGLVSVTETTDGGAIATGYCSTGTTNTDIFLVKTKSDGTTDWVKNYGSTKSESGNTVLLGSDGGYLVIGQSPFTMLKVDNQGAMK